MKATIVGLLIIMSFQLTMGQTPDTKIRIYDNSVGSVQISPEINHYLPPIYILGSDIPLKVNFDILNPDVQYLRYRVVHCDATWQPSVLVESEYIDGFNEADITDYAMSEATFVNYYNYNFTIPNDDLFITKSGNYLLQVFPQDDPERVLFQTRFYVSENTVNVIADVTSQTDVDYNSEHQQVNFTIRTRQGAIADPYNELTAIVMQNSRYDNARIVNRPLMVGGGEITFDHNPDLIFTAGNEYRRFETVSTNYMNMGVAEIKYYHPYYHATLYTDEARNHQQYLYDRTQHGRFTIRNAEMDDDDTRSDYIITHFTLNTEGIQYTDGKLFLQGEFTNGLPLSKCLMKWDSQNQIYYCDILLKQGHYNYQYLWVPDGTSIGLTSKIEGDKYQTINEYLILVYDRPMGERYDHLIGYALINPY